MRKELCYLLAEEPLHASRGCEHPPAGWWWAWWLQSPWSHTLWEYTSPVPAGWRSLRGSPSAKLMPSGSRCMWHGPSVSHHSVTDLLSYVPSAQNFHCHWKFPMIHEDHIFLNSRKGIIFQLHLIAGNNKDWTHRKYFRNFWVTLILLTTKYKRKKYKSIMFNVHILPFVQPLSSASYLSSPYVIHIWIIWSCVQIVHHLNY